jgi:hypothetical protein
MYVDGSRGLAGPFPLSADSFNVSVPCLTVPLEEPATGVRWDLRVPLDVAWEAPYDGSGPTLVSDSIVVRRSLLGGRRGPDVFKVEAVAEPSASTRASPSSSESARRRLPRVCRRGRAGVG